MESVSNELKALNEKIFHVDTICDMLGQDTSITSTYVCPSTSQSLQIYHSLLHVGLIQTHEDFVAITDWVELHKKAIERRKEFIAKHKQLIDDLNSYMDTAFSGLKMDDPGSIQKVSHALGCVANAMNVPKSSLLKLIMEAAQKQNLETNQTL